MVGSGVPVLKCGHTLWGEPDSHRLSLNHLMLVQIRNVGRINNRRTLLMIGGKSGSRPVPRGIHCLGIAVAYMSFSISEGKRTDDLI